jgi:hypothetical protein
MEAVTRRVDGRTSPYEPPAELTTNIASCHARSPCWPLERSLPLQKLKMLPAQIIVSR